MFVKPTPGRIVIRPDTMRDLAPAGEDVPEDPYWFNRLIEGDVTRSSSSQRGTPAVLSDSDKAKDKSK